MCCFNSFNSVRFVINTHTHHLPHSCILKVLDKLRGVDITIYVYVRYMTPFPGFMLRQLTPFTHFGYHVGDQTHFSSLLVESGTTCKLRNVNMNATFSYELYTIVDMNFSWLFYHLAQLAALCRPSVRWVASGPPWSHSSISGMTKLSLLSTAAPIAS